MKSKISSPSKSQHLIVPWHITHRSIPESVLRPPFACILVAKSQCISNRTLIDVCNSGQRDTAKLHHDSRIFHTNNARHYKGTTTVL
jgi:hypothetical protein